MGIVKVIWGLIVVCGIVVILGLGFLAFTGLILDHLFGNFTSAQLFERVYGPVVLVGLIMVVVKLFSRKKE